MAETSYLPGLFKSVRLERPADAKPMISEKFVPALDEKEVTIEARFMSALAALVQNVPPRRRTPATRCASTRARCWTSSAASTR